MQIKNPNDAKFAPLGNFKNLRWPPKNTENNVPYFKVPTKKSISEPDYKLIFDEHGQLFITTWYAVKHLKN